jgi:hypothetical protein
LDRRRIKADSCSQLLALILSRSPLKMTIYDCFLSYQQLCNLFCYCTGTCSYGYM